MKYKFIAAALLVMSSNAYAGGYCESLAGLAETTMSVRQAGVPLTDVISTYDKDTPNIVKAMTIMAYDSPMWGSDKMKRQAATEFSNKVYLMCFKKVGSK